MLGSDILHHLLRSFCRHLALDLAGPNILLSSHCAHNVSSSHRDGGKVYLHFHGSPSVVLNFKVTDAKDLDPPCRLPFQVLEVHQSPQCPVFCLHLKVSSVNVVVKMTHSRYQGHEFLPRHTVLSFKLC